MAIDYDQAEDGARRSRPILRALILIGLAFAAGAAAMGYLLTHWSGASRYLPTGAAPAPAPVTVFTPQPTTPAQRGPSEAIDRRVADLEARIGQIGARASAAVGNADRAEGLLVAFAARRALDRGVPLGYMEALLRERFGDSQPQAVATILSAARQPVTIDMLQSGLDDVGPALTGQGPDVGWWEGVRRELAGLVIVRRTGSPSPEPAARLARARRQLDAGHVGAALAEVARMPGRDRAADWIVMARRYAAARDALDVIETAALVEPRPAPMPPAPAEMPAAADSGEAPAVPPDQVTAPRTL